MWSPQACTSWSRVGNADRRRTGLRAAGRPVAAPAGPAAGVGSGRRARPAGRRRRRLPTRRRTAPSVLRRGPRPAPGAPRLGGRGVDVPASRVGAGRDRRGGRARRWAGRPAGRRPAPPGGLEALDAGQQGLRRVVGLGMGQPDQGHLEVDPGVGGVPHRHLGQAQHLHGPDQGGQTRPARPARQPASCAPRRPPPTSSGATRARKPWRRWSTRSPASCWGLKPADGQMGHGHQGPADVPFGQRLDDLVELGQVVVDRVGGHHLVEHGERVPGRPPAPAHGQVQGLVGHVEVGVPADLVEQLAEGLGAEEAELEVLGAAPDGGQHLLGVGGGQHEHDVGGRLLQRLQQGVRRRRREHVDLVDDVDLLAARGPEGGPGHQVPHGLHPVVGGGVELVDVERGALGDLHAGGAHPARLAVAQVGAVEGLGQDPGRRGLAGPPGPAEQVGVGHPAVADRVAEGEDDVVLAPHLGEGGRAGSVGRATGRASRRVRRPRRVSLSATGGACRRRGRPSRPRRSVRRPG